MLQAVQQHLDTSDVFIGAAAVADYTVLKPLAQKHKKTQAKAIHSNNPFGPEVEWTLSPDILAHVGQVASQRNTQSINNINKQLYVIGFAAETENLDAAGQEKMVRKKAHCMIGNLAQHTFGQDQIKATLYQPNQAPYTLPIQAKLHASMHILCKLLG